MNHSRLVKAMKKAGFQVETKEYSNNLQIVNGKKYCVSWYIQDDKAVCVNVARHGDESDAMVDYHAGFFVNTIKYAVQCALEV